MYKPRKRFGQNFLKDPVIIERIIQVIQPQPQDQIIEIGPGFGALTLPLLKQVKKLQVIELDRDLIPYLKIICENAGELIIHQGDVLRFDFSTLANGKNNLRIVGNLPYNISTPLIFHLLPQRQYIKDMHFMLQKEVVERMIATPDSKTYGRLSVMLQYYCEMQHLFNISSQAFDPVPKVESAMVRIIPRKPIPFPAKDEKIFAILVREAFNHRRKTLHNALKGYVDSEAFEKANVDPNLRPEQLSITQFVALANATETLFKQ